MKYRIFKKSDQSVIYSCPSIDYQNIPDFKGAKFPKETQGLPYIDIEENEAPVSESETGNYHEMIYFDGECELENLKQDKEWAAQLMPLFLIKQKQENFINTILDSELEKESPDVIEVVRKCREKEKLKNKNESELYKMALENLSRSEIDKPIIREKLIAKIEELKTK